MRTQIFRKVKLKMNGESMYEISYKDDEIFSIAKTLQQLPLMLDKNTLNEKVRTIIINISVIPEICTLQNKKITNR